MNCDISNLKKEGRADFLSLFLKKEKKMRKKMATVSVLTIGIMLFYVTPVKAEGEGDRGIISGSIGIAATGLGTGFYYNFPTLPPSLQVGALFRYFLTEVVGIQADIGYAFTGTYKLEYSGPTVNGPYQPETGKSSGSLIDLDVGAVAKAGNIFAGGGLGYASLKNEFTYENSYYYGTGTTTYETSGFRLFVLLGVDIPIASHVSLGAQTKAMYGLTGDTSWRYYKWTTDLGGFETKVYVGYKF